MMVDSQQRRGRSPKGAARRFTARNAGVTMKEIGRGQDWSACPGPLDSPALMQGCRLGAGVRKPPREETAGRRGAGGERRRAMGIWRLVERRAVLLRARFVAGREQRSGLRPAD